MNDDLVQPKRGFGTHPHRDMEIVTYVVDGHLTHKDSNGNVETLGRGSVQFMTAGRGIEHSEDNRGTTPLRFVQSWILPRRANLEPNYGSLDGAKTDRTADWVHLAADYQNFDAMNVPIKIHQDCNCYVTELVVDKDQGSALRRDFKLDDKRQAYVLNVQGDVDITADDTSITPKHLDEHDAAELVGPLTLTFSANTYAHLLLFEMKAAGHGRPDAEA